MTADAQQRTVLQRLQQAHAALEKMEARLQLRERSRTEPIAVVGMACRFPGGADHPDALWERLQAGTDVIGEVPPDRWDHDALYDPDPEVPGKISTRAGGFLEDIAGFDARFFDITPREAASLDPQHRLLLEVCWEALENAAIPARSLAGTRAGVFTGLSTFDYVTLQIAQGSYEQIDPYLVTGGFPCMAAGRVAYTLGLNGPAMVVDTACSSALVAVHLACCSLRLGECELALAGGVNLMLTPELSINFSKARMLSPDGRCKTFDAAANGYVRGEGCGVVVLKRLSDAEAAGDRVFAVIRGSAVNHDGVSAGITVPNGQAQAAVLRQALADARVSPDQVGYLEAHGTGTALGDPLELEAIDAVFGRERARPLVVGSVKTNVGHTEAAAGMAGLLKALYTVHHGVIPPHLHFHTPNPKVAWDRMAVEVPTALTAWRAEGDARVAGVSSFGASGTNAHVVVEAYRSPAPAARSDADARAPYVLTLSAKSPEALSALARRFAEYIAAHPGVDPDDLCFSANAGRTHFERRLAVVGASTAELGAKLAAAARGDAGAGIVRGEATGKARSVFLFTGQGAQFPGMGRELYESEPVFREAINQCDAILRGALERPLLDLMFPSTETGAALIHRTENAQPALFALEYATAKLLERYGARPDAVLGHSVGEYVAACVAGVFSLEDGLRLIAARGRLMGSLPAGGAMISAMGDAARIHAVIAPHRDAVDVAAYNGPDQIVISGREDAVAKVRASLDAQGVRTLPLTVSHAFHSPLMEPILDAFARAARAVSFSPPRLRLASNRSGAVASAELCDPQYWAEHIRRPVHFADGITTLHGLGYDLFVELGPKPVLCGMGRRCLADPAAATWIATQQPGQQRATFMTALAQLYVRGAPIDWRAQHRGPAPCKLALPTYPFQRKPYWVRFTRKKTALPTQGAPVETPLLGQRLAMAATEELRFEALLAHDHPGFLSDHVIHDAVIMPASAYVEMALSAAARAFGAEQVIAEQIQLAQPMLFQPNTRKTCQMILEPVHSSERLGFRIFSRDVGAGHGAPWTLHCDGKVRAAAPAEASETLAAVRARCNAAVDVDHLYRHYRSNGLQLGPAFRAVEEAWTGSWESLGRVALAEKLKADRGAYLFHPAMLDACFQVAGPLFLHLLEENNYLPVSLGAVRLFRAQDPVVFCHARMEPLPAGDALPEFVNVDLTIFGASGDLIARIDGLRFRKTDSQSILRGLHRERDKSLYQVEWRALPPSLAPLLDRGERTWIVFRDRQGVGEHLARSLGREPGELRWIVPGQSYRRDAAARHFELDPADPAQLARLVEDLAASAPHPWELLHLWSLDISGSVDPGAADLLETQSLGCGSVLHLVQALMKRGHRAKLWLVTRGAQAVGSRAAAPDPFQSTLWGLGPTLRLEHPELAPVLIDLDPADPAAEGLADLIARGTEEDRLALRDGQRWAQRLARLDGDVLSEKVANVAADAAYLISGGFGALGLRVAQWLASRGARTLILVGRSEPSAAAEQALARLRADGVRVQPFFTDIANSNEVARIFREAAETLPPVRGVVHAAGVLDDHALLNTEWASFQRVFAPKLAGAWHLHRHSASAPLDFFIAFSSMATVLGSPGQANYAAANAFLDALAHLRRAQGLPGLSIQWGPWAGGGMATEVSGPFQSGWRDLGLNLLQPERALRQMERLVAAGIAQAGVLEVAWPQLLGKRFRGVPPPFFAAVAEESRAGASAAGRAAGGLRARLEGSPIEQRRALLAQQVRAVVADVMALESPELIEPRRPLMDAGMDSLMALEVRNRLEKELGVTLGSTLLFDYPTLEALERHLAEEALPRSLFDAGAPRTAPAPKAEPRRQSIHGELDLDDIPADLADDQVVAMMIAELQAIKEERA